MALVDRGVMGGPLQPVILAGSIVTGVIGAVSIDQTTPGVTNGVQVVAALPAGTNNIGDVDVLSVIPGTGATNLGKAEDAAHTSGDVGIMSLAVRKDTATSMAAADDYHPLEVDSVGNAWVSLGTKIDKVNDSISVFSNTVADGTGTPTVPITDAAGHTQVDVLSITAGTAGAVLSLASSAARTTSASGAGVDASYYRRMIVLLDVTASATAANDTLDVYVDALITGTTWVNAIHFTQQAGDGAARKEFAVLDSDNPGTASINVTTDAAATTVRPAVFGSQLRARWVIVDGGGADQSHTFSVVAYAQ